MDAYEISASAMTAQRLRLDMIAGNLANVNTTRQADGSVGPYRRRNVIFAPILQDKIGKGSGSLPMKASGTFAGGPQRITFENGVPTLKAGISHNAMVEGTGVQVIAITEDTKTPLKTVYDPTHPDANADGYVSLPNINPVTEMVDMIAATRAYEANVTSLQSAKSMNKSALDI